MCDITAGRLSVKSCCLRDQLIVTLCNGCSACALSGSGSRLRDLLFFAHQLPYLELERYCMGSVAGFECLFLLDASPISLSPIAVILDRVS